MTAADRSGVTYLIELWLKGRVRNTKLGWFDSHKDKWMAPIFNLSHWHNRKMKMEQIHHWSTSSPVEILSSVVLEEAFSKDPDAFLHWHFWLRSYRCHVTVTCDGLIWTGPGSNWYSKTESDTNTAKLTYLPHLNKNEKYVRDFADYKGNNTFSRYCRCSTVQCIISSQRNNLSSFTVHVLPEIVNIVFCKSHKM